MKVKYESNKCPHCGATVGINGSASYFYGSPVRTCGQCKNNYIDKSYHEIEIDGIREEDLSSKAGLRSVMLIALIAAFLVLGNVYLISRGRVRVGLLLLALLSLILFVYSIVDAVKIKTGKKKKELEAERQASVARLQNPEYARLLAELGYKVPEKYL